MAQAVTATAATARATTVESATGTVPDDRPAVGNEAPAAPLPDFDLEDLRTDKTVKARLLARLLAEPEWLFALLRRFKPIAKPPGLAQILVTRYDDVVEVLERDDVFGIPFGYKVEALCDGPNFVLGMDDGPEYRRYHAQVMQAFRRDDIDRRVAPLAEREAAAIVAACPERFDVVRDLFTRVAVRVCQDYFGVAIPEDRWQDFAVWELALSSYLFADPGDNPAFRRAATAAAARVRALVDDSIAAARRAPDGRDTIQARLLAMQAAGAEGLSDPVLRTYLIGMMTGFVPTNTLAAANILHVLMRHPDWMETTCAAFRAGDDARLRRCLLEALRFKPVFWGPFRVAKRDYMLAGGTRHATLIRAGTRLSPAVQSAMRDARRVGDPHVFDPDRPPIDSMVFGRDLHWCVGALIAEAHLMACFKALLSLKDIRPAPGEAGKRKTFGLIVHHQFVDIVR